MAKQLKIKVQQQQQQQQPFEISTVTLSAIVQQHNWSLLQRCGGVEGVRDALQVSAEAGVTDDVDDRRRRVAAFGSNTYTEQPARSLWSFVWSAIQDATLAVLAACAVVSLGVGIATQGIAQGWYDGAGILLSILLVVIVTSGSDYQQYLQFRDLDKEKGKVLVQVTREGTRERVLVQELVVGDIVHLHVGDKVPADGLLLSSQSLVVDEASMTGECEPKAKSCMEQPFMISGTKVVDGYGTMLVTGVGMNTEWGHAMSILSGSGDVDDAAGGSSDESTSSGTPLQAKLSKLAALIGKVGMVFAALTFLVLLTKLLIAKHEAAAFSASGWTSRDVMTIVGYFATAVTIVVVAVPEGLPLAVTLSLAFAMKQMMREKALVRHLAACETMGSATCICSDKTGTMTTNQMTVVKAWLGGAGITSANSLINSTSLVVQLKDLLLEGIFQNTSGDVGDEVIGSPTEAALLRFGLSLAGSHSAFGAVRKSSTVVRVEPFNSERKKMGVVVQQHGSSSYRVHWKGAPEIILSLCDRYLDLKQGTEEELDMDSRLKLTGAIKDLADQELRTLCLAYKEVYDPAAIKLEATGYTCLAIVGIKDPVRPGVSDAVRLCCSAGITVRMVTGDNLYTAMAVARECGVLTDDGEAVEGPEFRSWSSDEMRKRIPKLQVLARTSPSDKHRLVKELQAMGEVVAVTGDGTNDAPALYEADIGIAMGIAGTEVAKESADIIILDDEFASIVNVVKWGRSVFVNIQKFVQFQSTVNLVALLLNFWSACSTGEVPLTVVQLLWVNLIMDTLGALALATEPPHDGLMKRPPVGSKEHFVSSIMCRNVVVQAAYQLLVLIFLQYKGKQLFGLQASGAHGTKVLNTIIFNTFVFFQVFNEFNSREMEKINVFRHMNNWIFIAVVSVTIVFQVLLIEFFGKLASTKPLRPSQWAFCIAIASLSLLLDLAVKSLHLLLPRSSFLKSRCRKSSTFLHDPLIPKATTPSRPSLWKAGNMVEQPQL